LGKRKACGARLHLTRCFREKKPLAGARFNYPRVVQFCNTASHNPLRAFLRKKLLSPVRVRQV
jgi:hypothetical protein